MNAFHQSGSRHISRVTKCIVLTFVSSTMTQAEVIQWVGTQSDQMATNGAASFHDAENWFNFITPGPSDVAVLGSGFDPQGTNTFPRHIYFGKFQTQYFPPSPGGDAPPIPAQDAVIAGLDIVDGDDWIFNFGTNAPLPHDGSETGSLTTQTMHLGATFDGGPLGGRTAALKVVDGKITVAVAVHMGGYELDTASLVLEGDNTELDAGYIDLGLAGEGTIRLEEGASLSASSSFGPLWIGIFDGGRGHLIATGGSSVSGGGALGREIGSFGTATISGGSTWTMGPDGGLAVGYGGSGKLQIESGGYVEGRADIGIGEFSDSSVTVTGDGSIWNVRGLFGIGSRGHGTLHVLDDGHVFSEDAIMGWEPGSEASVEVYHGLWEVNGNTEAGRTGVLTIGLQGSAQLSVSGTGVVSVRRELRIGEQGSIDVSSPGIVNVGEGDVPDPGVLRIGANGILSGSGTITGNALVDGGTVAPGASPGDLHINGNYHQTVNGMLTMEIGGTTPGTEYDRLLVTGDLLLEGIVQISFINNFIPKVGDTFELLGGGGTFTPPSVVNISNVPSAFNYTSKFENGVFSLTVVSVPEPSAVLLISLAVMAGTLATARRRGAVAGRFI